MLASPLDCFANEFLKLLNQIWSKLGFCYLGFFFNNISLEVGFLAAPLTRGNMILIAWILHEALVPLHSLTGLMKEREWKQQVDES